MTSEILIILIILGAGIVLFVTEIIRMDLTALIVLVALYFSGLVEPEQVLSGFSNPAVIAVGAMFVLSAGLTRTGVSSIIGKQVLKLAGNSEARLIAVIMVVTAILSSFMNNVAIAAMFLPITLEISRRTKFAPSRLLLPMAYGSLLGGLILLIGTASNLVVRDVIREAGYQPLGIFDFTLGGLIILLICVLYMTLIGRRFLPLHQSPHSLFLTDTIEEESYNNQYRLNERLATLILSKDNPLIGTTLIESRIGRALGVNVVSIQRKNGSRVGAEAHTVLESGDRLVVLGRLDRIEEIRQNPIFVIQSNEFSLEELVSNRIGLAELKVYPESNFINKTLSQLNFRQIYDVHVLAVRQGENVRRTNFQDLSLNVDDRLVVLGAFEKIEEQKNQPGFHQLSVNDAASYRLEERLLKIRIPENSPLIGHTLTESRLGADFGLEVLMYSRNNQEFWIATPDLKIMADDLLIVSGRPMDIDVLKGLQALQVDLQTRVDWKTLVSGEIQLIEVMLSPYSNLGGKTLSELRFREKFDISVLAIWRGERSYRSNLNNFPIKHGDALLCYGDEGKLRNLAKERDYVIVSMDFQEEPRSKKAPIAGIIMSAVILTTIFFGVPISLAAIAGCVLMVISGALNMEEAYQGIDWRSLFVIAAMMPLGIAMQQTGAAALLGRLVVDSLGSFGNTIILAGLMLLTITFTQFMPNAAIAVIMTPIAITVSSGLEIDPKAFVMGIAYALAAAFLSPVAHPANLLVMSPGGYRFSDYLKHGLPIMVIVVLTSIILLPIIFPY